MEIQVELEELEDIEEQPLFEIDPFDAVLGQEGDSSDFSDADTSDDEVADDFSDLSSDAGDEFGAEAVSEVPANVKHIQDMVKKLDSILTLVFEHFGPTHTTGPTDSNNASRSLELLPLPPLPPTASDSLLTSPTMSSPPPLAFLNGELEPIFTSPPASTPLRTTPPQNSVTTIRIQFNALLSIFDRTILRTFKSRYTQFLIFWFTSLDPEFADIFQGMLVERALFGSPSTSYRPPDPLSGDYDDGVNNGVSGAGGSTIMRAAAASYIGSFVSRAVFVDVDSTRRVVAVLCEFLSAHLDEVEESLRTFSAPVTVGGPQHTVFYAVTQAVFLIFCFRWRDLLDLEGDDEGDNVICLTEVTGQGENGVGGKTRKWMPELGVLHRVVNSVLNPLKVCLRFRGLSFGATTQCPC